MTYRDPIYYIIWELPYISAERKREWLSKWANRRPKFVTKAVNWYRWNDANVILFLRTIVTLSPLVLGKFGVRWELLVSLVAVGIMITEILSRKRIAVEIEEAKRESEQEREREREKIRRRRRMQNRRY